MAEATLAFNILSKYKDAGAKQAATDLGAVGKSAIRMGDSAKKGGKEADTALAKVRESASKTKDSIAKIGGVAAGAGLGFGLVAGFDQALDNLDADAKLKAQLGLGAKASERAGRIAGSLFSHAYGDSLGTVNEAIRHVVQDTGTRLSSVNFEGITGKVLSLSDTFDQDLGGVTRAVGQLMRTGLAKNATQALDIVASGFQNGADKSEDFLDTLNEYGTQFRKLGIDGKTATGLIAQGLKAGARDGDIVADALKEFSIRAIDGSDLTGKAYKQLGLDAKRMQSLMASGGKGAAFGLSEVLNNLRKIKDPAKKAQLAVALFGTQAEDMGEALFALDPSKAVDTLGKVGGAAARLDKTVGATAGATLTAFKRSVQQNITTGMAAVITGFQTGKVEGDGFSGTMSQVGATARDVGEAVKTSAEWLNKHRGVVVTVVAAYAAWKTITLAMKVQQAASLAMLKLHTVGTVENAVATKAAAAAAKVWAAGQWLLNAALTANPIGLIVVGIVALAAGIVVAYKKSETFRGIVKGLLGGLKTFGEFIGGKLLGFVKLLASGWLMMGEYGVKAFRLLLTAAFAVFEGILAAADKGLGWIPGIGDKIGDAKKAFSEFSDKTVEKLKGVENSLHRTRDAINAIKSKRVTITLVTRRDGTLAGGGGHEEAGSAGAPTGRTAGRLLGRILPRGTGDRLTAAGANLLTSVVKGIDSKKVLLTNAMGKVGDYIKSQTERIRDLMSQKMDLAGQFAGFTSSVFSNDLSDPTTGAGPTAGDLIAFQKAELEKALQIKADTQKLIKQGLSKDLVNQLANSGESGIAQLHALATGSAADVSQLNALNAQTQAALAAAGMSAGSAVFGDKIAQAEAAKANALEIRNQLEQWRKQQDKNTIVQIHLEGRTLQMSLLELKRKSRQPLGLS